MELTGLVLLAVLGAAFLYALYWVVRRGVAAGIRDDRERRSDEHATFHP